MSALELGDQQLLRYNRQIMLDEIGIEGQQRLWESRILLLGMGGLGSPIAMYLASSGVGTLELVDHDDVDLSNLQRQIVHTTRAVGTPKVTSAKATLTALNPDIQLLTRDHKLEGDALIDAVRAADVVVDGTDNFSARFAVNRACYETGTPLVSGAVIRMEGQVSVFAPGSGESPCYNCLHREVPDGVATCAENGVLGAVAGIIGTIQATEAIKVLLGIGEPLLGRLLLLDARTMEFQTIRLKRSAKCPTCGVGDH
ncbi:MAG: molybdopterin-synthase adenylyltransferase MoeB [Gammaproteobacteria bacterium]|nr:molybdopterin-synthase adenylyltransferase MoeB [Gammaproteobacteria bacterium]